MITMFLIGFGFIAIGVVLSRFEERKLARERKERVRAGRRKKLL